MRRFTLTALAVVGLVAMVFAAGGSAGTSQTPKKGGTVVFGAEQEPPCMNTILAGCNNTWTSWTAFTSLRGLYIQKPDFTIVPDIAAGPAKVIDKSPFTLQVSIKKNAVWNDGTPITAKDFIMRWKTTVDPKVDMASRSGWDSIARVIGTGKTFKVVYKKPFAPWAVQFTDSLLPAHALQGADMNTVWNNAIVNPKTNKPIGNGPFIFSNYTKGQSITMTRNPKWWGPHAPYLDKVVFVFRTNTDTEIQAIRGGEVDVIYPQPQLQLADLKGQSGLKVESNAGTTLEHIDFNSQLKGGMPLLRAPWFRQAISYSIDRTAMVKQLFRTLNPKPDAAAEPDLREQPEGSVRPALPDVQVQPRQGHPDHAEARLHEGQRRHLVVWRRQGCDQVRHDRGQPAP